MNKQMRYLVKGKPATQWFNCKDMPLFEVGRRERVMNHIHGSNWSIEYREV